jgi:hypothetical protein
MGSTTESLFQIHQSQSHQRFPGNHTTYEVTLDTYSTPTQSIYPPNLTAIHSYKIRRIASKFYKETDHYVLSDDKENIHPSKRCRL